MAPKTVIVCEPMYGVVEPTVNEPLTEPPLAIVHDTAVVMSGSGVLESVQAPTSPTANPLPVTVTTVPRGPEVWLRVIFGELVVTVNVAEPKSPSVPVAVIVCAPSAAGIVVVNDPVIVPVGVKVHVDVKWLMISGSGILVKQS